MVLGSLKIATPLRTYGEYIVLLLPSLFSASFSRQLPCWLASCCKTVDSHLSVCIAQQCVQSVFEGRRSKVRSNHDVFPSCSRGLRFRCGWTMDAGLD